MLQSAYLLANIRADTAENEQHFAEILPTKRRDAPPRRIPDHALNTASGLGGPLQARKVHRSLPQAGEVQMASAKKNEQQGG